MSYEKLFENNISSESVKAWKASGKKAIGYVCCHVPTEILIAADIMPVRLRATNCVDSSDAEAWMSSFSCSFARSILQYLMNGTYELDGLVQSDGCMMATRILDNWEHISKKNGKEQFVYQVGAPRITNDTTIAYYKSELQDLADKLGAFSGTKVTDDALKAAIAKTNEIRDLIDQVYDLRREAKVSGTEALNITLAHCDYTVDEYIALLKEFLADAKNRKPIEARARLMIIGSALDNPEYIKVIEEKGGLVVADALCFGAKAFGDKIAVDDADVMGSIAKYYLTRNTCPRSLDNRPAIHKEIVDACKKFDVQGVIYEKMQNCECWGGEAYYLEPDLKAEGIPMLQLEREEHMANAGQLAIRAEAFIEMLDK
ncbi:MAG: 2-hydroxyacyl-CoA dehydratase [Clostridiales bacterium]|jgi:benzoyl-CoA reductase subunit C|nr:2-hydroxyacyl-CoA dehydratase [Clostridiales bacterium]